MTHSTPRRPRSRRPTAPAAVLAAVIAAVVGIALLSRTAPAADEAMEGPKTATGPRMPAGRTRPVTGVPGSTPVVANAKWLTAWTPAAAAARKEDKLIMAFFTGSDWDDFSMKLFKEVLNTPMFLEWAAKNVILFEVDFPSPDKRQAASLKAQNERLKQKYNIQRVPTIVFMDADGEPYVTCGYDTAKLRDDEKKGAPLKWLEFANNAVLNKPGKELLKVEPTFAQTIEDSRKKGLPALFLLTKDKNNPRILDANQQVINSQKFIRFANRTVFFKPITWPEDSDLSPEAKQIRDFITANNIGNAPVQFALYQAGQKKVKLKVTIFSPSKITALVKQITNELPKFDYTGNWLSDFQMASSVAMQMKRELLVAFVSMDGSEWSKKIDEEIFRHPEFKEYAGKYLVLCRIDFPKTKPLPPEVAEAYNALASRYGVRGYPTVILLNDGGQNIGNAKYQKGGPQPFLKEVDDLRKKDYERRTLMSDQVEIVD
jgi:thioredoxin-related protein